MGGQENVKGATASIPLAPFLVVRSRYTVHVILFKIYFMPDEENGSIGEISVLVPKAVLFGTIYLYTEKAVVGLFILLEVENYWKICIIFKHE